MSGKVQAEFTDPANQAFAGEQAVEAIALPGWWILPCVVLGASFWALLISWAFGFG